MNMNITFDDGGFALDGADRTSLNVPLDAGDDAWDDTEILQIFDEAVRSHVTKGQPRKNKKEQDKPSSSKSSAMKKSRTDTPADDEVEVDNSLRDEEKHQSPVDNQVPPYLYSSTPFAHPMPPISHQQPQSQQSQQCPQHQPQQSSFSHLAGLSSPEFDSALSDMLAAWYQSGYATGKFYTLLEQQQKTQREHSEWWQQYGSGYAQHEGSGEKDLS